MPLSGEMAFVSVNPKKALKVNIRKPLTSFIHKEFGEPPEGFFQALDELSNQRAACIEKAPEKHESGLRAVMKYYGWLQCLNKRFPLKTSEEWDGEGAMPINIKFEWEDTQAGGLFGKKTAALVDINFELINVLYNIGAVHSQIGASANTTSDAGLKNASVNFQNAAVVFNSVATLVHKYYSKAPSGDLDPNYLSALSFLMLAQSQEMFWKKCVVERKSNGLIAKLAKQTSAYYNDSFRNMSLAGNLDKTWVKICQAKGAYYEADAQYRRALDDREEEQYGSSIARLKVALSKLGEAMKAASSTGFSVSSLESSVSSTLKETEKQNSLIYMQPAPSSDSLPGLEQTSTVSAEKPLPDYTSPEYIGEDPFSKVVPLSVHQAVTRYKQKRAEHVQMMTTKLDESTAASVEKLVAMGLPGSLQAVENPDTVPEQLLQHAAEIRNHGGPGALRATIDSLPERSAACRSMVEDIRSSLAREEKEDSDLRAKYGSKWSRETSAKLNAQMRADVEKWASAVEKASESDATVGQRFQELEPALNFLVQPEDAIKAALPQSNTSSDSSEAVQELTALLTRMDELRRERDAMSTKYDEAMAADDITGVLIERLAVDDEISLFNEQMKAFTNLDDQTQHLVTETNEIIAKCESANERFTATKEGTNDRELMLNDLNAKFESWRVLSKDLLEGGKFYEQVSGLLARQQAKCADFCVARDLEKQELVGSITRNIATAPSEDYAAHFPSTQAQQQTMQQPTRPPPPAVAPSQPQPTSTPTPAYSQPGPYQTQAAQRPPQYPQNPAMYQPPQQAYVPPQQPPQYHYQPQTAYQQQPMPQYMPMPPQNAPYQQPPPQQPSFNFQQGMYQPPQQQQPPRPPYGPQY